MFGSMQATGWDLALIDFNRIYL